ncbi:hypothetical protein SAMN06265379_10385 [Saccharicrinis carchari]|uniref:Uncharacterized protein n=1 Tax=Saccharicrinis carchari TaxID=1168039 RepID=A0A521CFB0_SACCC|nr:hypothetical protein [Saccharicrinis carchari]SMO58109.1 hypothetical protein SAMN06265379_10385 [Saccharicrinis carchari]
MKNIFFIDRFPFNKEFFIRNEFEFLVEKGFNVRFLDLTRFLKRQEIESKLPPELEQYVVKFSSRKEFRDFIHHNLNGSVIISRVPYITSSAWMYYIIFKSKMPYVIIEQISFPSIYSTNKLKDLRHSYIKFFKKLNTKKIIGKPKEIYYFYASLFYLKSAQMIISSRIKGKSIFEKLIGKSTSVKHALSPDYKVAMEVENTVKIDEDYAVFIDQYFVHHPDFKTHRIVYNFTAEQYYTEINQFLSDFKKRTGLKVIIASHPRRQDVHTEDFKSEFDLYFNKTAELIQKSKVVLLHFSTAINFAVIFKKPFLLLHSDLFNQSNVSTGITMFSTFFDKETINMSNVDGELISNQLNFVDEEKYNEFLEKFIKHPKANDETFRDQILYIYRTLGR